MRRLLNFSSGHAITLLMLAACYGQLCWAGFIGHNWVRGWDNLGAWLPELIFLDLYSVTGTIESVNKGWTAYGEAVESLTSNSRFSGLFVSVWMNYPRLWITIGKWLHLYTGNTWWMAITLIVLFFTTTLCMFRQLSLFKGIILGAALLSPAVTLGMHRANNDILVYVVVAACMVSSRKSWMNQYVRPALIFFIALLKLFPIVALVAFVQERPAFRKHGFLLLLSVAFGLYCLSIRGDIALMNAHANSFERTYNTFGSVALFSDMFPIAPDSFIGMHVRFILAVAVAALAYLWFRGAQENAAYTTPDTFESRCFIASAMMYVGVFFALGSNWDYRLMFLISLLPQLFLWLDSPYMQLRKRAVAFVLLIMLSLWAGEHIYISQCAKWALCLLCVHYLSAHYGRIMQQRPDQAGSGATDKPNG